MRYFLLVTLSFCAVSFGAEKNRIIGLVEIPKLFGTADPNGPPGQTPPQKIEAFPLFAAPDAKAKAAQNIGSAEAVVSREHGYEEVSAVALEEKKGWYRLELPAGSGWLAPKDAGRFRTLESLVTDKLAYLTFDWDGRVHASPGDKKHFKTVPTPKDDGSSEPSWRRARAGAKVVGRKKLGSEIWLRVEVFAPQAQCEGNAPKPTHTGWVPLHSPTGAPNLWFFSRGC